MAHGYPDWFGSLPGQNIFGGVDVLEAAARLGAWATTTRRGNLIYTMFFAGGQAELVYRTLPDDAIVGTSTKSIFPNMNHLSIKLPTTVNEYVGIEIANYHPPATNIALEHIFFVTKYIGAFSIYTEFISPAKAYFAWVHFKFSEQKICFYTTDNNTICLTPPFMLTYSTGIPNMIRIGLDLINCKYNYVTLNYLTFIPPNIPLNSTMGRAENYMFTHLLLKDNQPGCEYIPCVFAIFINDY